MGSFEACALRETREEAGINGNILFDLGWYKARAAKDNSETRTRFFGMEFVGEAAGWQEELERQRCWFYLDEAIRLVDWSPMLVEMLKHLQAQCLLQVLSLTPEHCTCGEKLDYTDVSESPIVVLG
jgi:8-oxo-dGTP pyrophosphatase MutT (NUDIX family)